MLLYISADADAWYHNSINLLTSHVTVGPYSELGVDLKPRRSMTPGRETSVLTARSVFAAIRAASRCLHYIIS